MQFKGIKLSLVVKVTTKVVFAKQTLYQSFLITFVYYHKNIIGFDLLPIPDKEKYNTNILLMPVAKENLGKL